MMTPEQERLSRTDKHYMARVSQDVVDTNNAEQQVTFATKVKRQNRIIMIGVAILAAIIIVATFVFFKGEKTKLEGQIKEVRGEYEQYKKDKAIRDAKIDSIGSIIQGVEGTIDDLQSDVAVTDEDISRLHRSLITTTKKNEKFRDSIRALPFDDRMRFFASWLPEIDSNARR